MTVDLSVDLCGVRLRTPVLAASGCFGFGREMAGWVDLAALGGIVTKSEIEDSLYAFGAEVESNAVEVYVSRLRKKLGREFVETIRGLGYQVRA